MLLKNKIFSNSAWIMSEKFINIFGLIFVTSYMAKYIGPDNFGKMTYTSSLFIFIQTLSWFGTQNILFKRLSTNVNSGIKLSFSSKFIRICIYLTSSTFILTYLWWKTDLTTVIYGLGNFIASYFIINDVFTIYNNSQLKSYINTLANVIGTLLALALRFLLVFYETPVEAMIIPIVVLAIVPYCLKRYIFLKEFNRLKNQKAQIKKNKLKYNKYLIKAGGALVISTLSITLYNQIANILLAQYVSFKELGLYNVALTIGGAWNFISIALITSFFSGIYASKSFKTDIDYLRKLHLIIFFVTICVLAGVALIGEWFITKLYGEDFIKAYVILPLIVIAILFSAFGTIANRYLIKENGYKYISIKAISVALLSIPLYFILITKYGIIGAAYGFILTELTSLTLGNYFYKNGIIFKIHKLILLNKTI